MTTENISVEIGSKNLTCLTCGKSKQAEVWKNKQVL